MYSSPGKYIHEQNGLDFETQFQCYKSSCTGVTVLCFITHKYMYALQTSPGKYIHEQKRLLEHNLSAINPVLLR